MHLSVWFESHRPRMTTESGNLVFLTGASQNIEFRTGSLGKIKLNNEDLGDCLHQVINIWEGTWKQFCAAILVNAPVENQFMEQAWMSLEVKCWAWGASLEEKQIPGGNFSLGRVRSGRRNARWSVLRCCTLDHSLEQMQRRRCDLSPPRQVRNLVGMKERSRWCLFVSITHRADLANYSSYWVTLGLIICCSLLACHWPVRSWPR